MDRLDGRGLSDLEVDARRFWRTHNQHNKGIEAIVTEEEFVHGVLCFRDPEITLDAVNHAEDQQAQALLRKLGPLRLKDVRAIQWYFTKPTAPIAGNIVKRGIIRSIDRIHDKIWPPSDSTAKSKWDHIKTLSRGHMTVLATCIFAAITQ